METIAPSVLYPLLDYLDGQDIKENLLWQEWQITRITGGRNNLLYRLENGDYDLAVKFTVRDERLRVEREYGALCTLQHIGLTIAPMPVLVDNNRYDLPVMVQTWLAGEVSEAPPATEGEWALLADHYATIHSVTPNHGRFFQPLPPSN